MLDWLRNKNLTRLGQCVLLGTTVFFAPLSSAQSNDALDSNRQERKAALARCNGAFKNKTPTRSDLDRVLTQHRLWLRDVGMSRKKMKQASDDPRRANFCGANFKKLENVNLTGANLSAARLSGITLNEVNLRGADLSYIFATKAKFTGVFMNTGNLEGAWLQSAKFDDTTLSYGNLRNTVLLNTNLRNANIAKADLAGAIFEPELGTLPRFSTLVSTKNLSKLRYIRSPHGLIELREAFRKSGLREHERAVTYAIKHNERLMSGSWQALINYILFEATTQWGMVPSRALVLLASLILLCTPLYAIALRVPHHDGIWRVWSETRLRKDLGQDDPVRLQVGLLRALALGFYFSILSAFRVGWREFSVGQWIARIQGREYSYGATGWVRTVSGLQSLISVYLLALWTLTYFGRPFE